MTDAAPLWTAERAAEATGGRSQGGWSALGVSIDSRSLVPGDLFVALQGPNFDGHAFVAEALGKGAAAAIISRRPDGVSEDAPLLLVRDTFEALRALGRAGRARSKARIAGITGSVGKTGVKEALALALSRQGPTHFSVGSFNNHWGVPLSLARMPASSAFAIFEMGMNHSGEITPLTTLVRPHVAAITTVEAVHIENFGSTEGIADAKAEIFVGLEPGGAVVLNRDNAHFDQLVRRAGEAQVRRIISFGRDRSADARLIAADEGERGSRIEADVLGSRLSFFVGSPGGHWVLNALCVLACADALGADVRAAAAALSDLRPPKGRGLRTRVSLEDGTFELIDDSYNASPASMRASFQVLGRSRPGEGGRRIAVLGDMLELGSTSAALHAGLASALMENAIDLVFTAGPMSAYVRDALPAAMRAGHAAGSADLAPLVAAAVQAGDVVAVKGSAGSRMRLVVDALLALDRGNTQGTADSMRRPAAAARGC
jgi:UDP-N-acetylmuramoyl-tripeptide--D-alanyl-D-alanine ligase